METMISVKSEPTIHYQLDTATTVSQHVKLHQDQTSGTSSESSPDHQGIPPDHQGIPMYIKNEPVDVLETVTSTNSGQFYFL